MLGKNSCIIFYALSAAFVCFFVTPLAREGQPVWFPYLLFAFGTLGAFGFIGMMLGMLWGRLLTFIFGLSIIPLFFASNLSTVRILFAVAAGIVILPFVWPSERSDPRDGPTKAPTPPDIGARLRMAQTDGSDSIEVLQYNLAREKFLWEINTRQRENDFFNRNFGVIIAAIVSFSAVVVSVLQLGISFTNSRTQIDNERLKNDQQFYLEIAKFLLDRREHLEATDTTRVTYLRDVVVASFPPDAAMQIATNMRDLANKNEVRGIWEGGLGILRARKSATASQSIP